jgi:predicted ATPase
LLETLRKEETHFDQSIALYNPVQHRPLATRFGEDQRMVAFVIRSITLWMLGYPEAALADREHALRDAREIGQAGTLMFALSYASHTDIRCGKYKSANEQLSELVALADEKSAPYWKALGVTYQGCILALTGNAADAVRMIASGLAAHQSMRVTLYEPFFLSSLAYAHAELEQFDHAWRRLGEAIQAIETAKERWCEAEVNNVAGEIALMSPERDATKAQMYFERALAVARQQHAKSWELRAAMSLARLWRDQGKVQQARELLASVYGWFTEGFDTRDLKEAKALLDELAA